MSLRSVSMSAVRLCITAGLFIVAASSGAEAQAAKKAAGALILGEITSLSVSSSDPASGGRLVVDGKQIIVPEKLAIGLVSGPSSLQALMLDAGADCKAQQPPQSGLAATDSCRGEKPPALARVIASPNANGELVASAVMIQKNSARTLARIKPEAKTGDSSYGQSGGYAKRSRRQPKQ